MEVNILDSPDGHNPVIIISKETEVGVQNLPLDKSEAKDLANKLSSKLDEVEDK